MKVFVILIFIIVSNGNCFSQAGKVGFAVDVSNNLMRRFKNSRFITLSTASLGIDVKIRNSNLRLYGSYGYMNIRSKYEGGYNVTMKSHFAGGGLEVFFLNKSKIIQPYFNVTLLSEVYTNYHNGNIYFFYPIRFKGLPIDNEYYQVVYGANFYQSTPILLKVNAGASFRIVENLRLNLSIGYNLNVMNYKYVKWTKYDDREEMIRRTPMQKKALHSIAGQIGLNYVFSFQKKPNTEMS